MEASKGPESHYFPGMDRYEDFLRLRIHLNQTIMYLVFLIDTVRFVLTYGDKYVLLFTRSLLNCPFLRDNGQFDNGKYYRF